MAKITIFLLTTCAFGFLVCSELTPAALEKSEVLSEDKNIAVQDNAERRDSQLAGGTGGPYQSRPQSVECLACTDCQDITDDTQSKLCPYSLDPNKRGKCVVYAEKYKHMHRPWYIRGCASERGSCEEIKRAHENHGDMVSLLSCNECEGDRCNRNGASTFAAIAFVTLVIAPLLSKFTLS